MKSYVESVLKSIWRSRLDIEGLEPCKRVYRGICINNLGPSRGIGTHNSYYCIRVKSRFFVKQFSLVLTSPFRVFLPSKVNLIETNLNMKSEVTRRLWYTPYSGETHHGRDGGYWRDYEVLWKKKAQMLENN